MEQLPEIILIDGALHSLYTTPLRPWLRDQDNPPVFDQRSPGCERGYIGSWRITDGLLWLVGLYAWRDGVSTRLPDLFDDHREVMADWFSGPLIVEPAASEILDGAMPRVRALLVESGRVVRDREDGVES